MASTSRQKADKTENAPRKKRKTSISGVLSSTNKLSLTSEASFGDAMDIFREGKFPSVGGTISFVLDSRRQFEPGEYVMHVVKTEPKAETKVAILCLEGLCPMKIHDRLKTSNMGQDFAASNYMNRYDWFHMNMGGLNDEEFRKEKRNFRRVIRRDVFEDPDADDELLEVEDDDVDEDEEGERNAKLASLVFFVDVNYLADITAGNFSCEAENEWVFVMKLTGNEESHSQPIGFIIQDEGELFCGEYNYGCVLVDEKSAKCFAFVFGAHYTYGRYHQGQASKFDICKINYTLDKASFQ